MAALRNARIDLAPPVRNVSPAEMDTRQDPFWKHALLVFVACAVCYAAGFAAVQWWRERRGPWLVTFRLDAERTPAIRITQPRLGITDVVLQFPGAASAPLDQPVTVRFDEPTPGGKIPFGQIRFLDTTFLPGTVTLNLFGHEIELLPRTLIVDKVERPWRSGDLVLLPQRSEMRPSPPVHQP